MIKPKIIKGGIAVDDRGIVTFNNSFDMSPIKRFYMLRNHRQGFVRAWHGHLQESKWVCVVSGVAVVGAAMMFNRGNRGKWEIVPAMHQIKRFILHPNGDILYIPPGYANGHMNLVNGTRIMHFSDMSMEEVEEAGDDYRFDAGIHGWVWKVEER